jgi:hypothetical protein
VLCTDAQPHRPATTQFGSGRRKGRQPDADAIPTCLRITPRRR